MRALCLAATIVVAGHAASAGTRGSLYDFDYFLDQPYPLPAEPSVASATPEGFPVEEASAEPRSAATGGGGIFDRLYVGVAGGLDFPDEIEAESAGTSVGIEPEDGGVGLLTVGRYFGRSFRGELELGYRLTGLESATTGGATAPASGDADAATLMLNGFWDVDLGWTVRPYVGLGVGAARLQVDEVTVGGIRTGGDASTEFAWQGLAGIAWRVASDWTLTLDYRYLAIEGDSEFSTMSVAAGVRYDL